MRKIFIYDCRINSQHVKNEEMAISIIISQLQKQNQKKTCCYRVLGVPSEIEINWYWA